MNKFVKNIGLLFFILCTALMLSAPSYAGTYDKKLSKSERESLCTQLKNQQLADKSGGSLGGGIIPDKVLTSIYETTKKINDKTALMLTMGHSLTCHAVHAGKQSVTILSVELFDYPDFSVWLCGAIIYVVGFMMTMSITFYVVDIAFKLGFAVIMLPIGISLWPFSVTKDKLTTLISIILKSAGVFVFLAITVSYALNLVDSATSMNLTDEMPEFALAVMKDTARSQGLDWDNLGGMEKLFFMINNNATDAIAQNFTLFSLYFLVLMFAMVYGFKLIGSTIEDYVDKFFPDKAFGKAAPMHGSLTQAVDFMKSHTVDKAASWAGDVAKTQAGRVVQGTGKLMTGKYNDSIKHYMKNPGDISRNIASTVHGAGGTLAKGASSILTGTVGRVVLGKQASQDLQAQISGKIDEGVDKLNHAADGVAQKVNNFHQKNINKIGEAVDNVKEKFNNTAVGKTINQAATSVKQAHTNVKTAFDKRIDKLQSKRKSINAAIRGSKYYKAVTGFKDKAVSKIEQAEQTVIQAINGGRAKLNNVFDKGYEAIDKSLKANETDGKMKRFGKAIARGVSKGAIGIVDIPQRVLTGGAALTLNATTAALGGVAKTAVKGATGIAIAPTEIAGAVAKAPSLIAEGTLKVVNIPRNLKKAANATKSLYNFTGEILQHTGGQMQRNKKSDEQIRRERARKEEEEYLREKEQRQNGEW